MIIFKIKYELTEEIRSLKKLAEKPKIMESMYRNTIDKNNNKFENLLVDFDSLAMNEQKSEKKGEKVIFKNENLKLNITQPEHDSDDDDDDDDGLKPYDLSNDVPKSKANQPVFLRDCLEILVYSEEPDKIELALQSVEKLCSTYHYELEEV